MLLQFTSTPAPPEYTILPLLHRGLELRIALQESISHSEIPQSHASVTSHKLECEALENDFTIWYNELPDDRKQTKDGYLLLTLNIYRVHMILLQDALVRCYQRLNRLDQTSGQYEEEIEECVEKAQGYVETMCNSMPYSFLPDDPIIEETENSGKRILHHLSYS
jgi:hypothetical protein